MKYKIVQVKTYVPFKDVKGKYSVEDSTDGVWNSGHIFVKTPEVWMDIDTNKKQFSVGEYEG